MWGEVNAHVIYRCELQERNESENKWLTNGATKLQRLTIAAQAGTALIAQGVSPLKNPRTLYVYSHIYIPPYGQSTSEGESV